MKEQDFKRRIAYLESINDQLNTELRYIDALLKSIGFTEGLETVKCAAQELKDIESHEREIYEED